MSRSKIALLCLPVALAGVGVAVHATRRVRALEQDLSALATTGQVEGRSFVETLRGEHAERQRLAFERRRGVALELARARRDRLLGLLAVGASGLAAAALQVMSRIAAEVEADRRHVSREIAKPD
jgi:hypothetical protein